MGWQPKEQRPEQPLPVKTIKTNAVNGSVINATAVIVYGDVNGNVSGCQNVVVINGDVCGNINNCENVAGLFSEEYSGRKANE